MTATDVWEAQENTEAKVNVSLKGEKQTDPWITVEGSVDSVLRTLWKISLDARPHAEAKNLFAAAKAASAEYLKSKPAAPTVVPKVARVSPVTVEWDDASGLEAALEADAAFLADDMGDPWADVPPLTEIPNDAEDEHDLARASALALAELGGTVVEDDDEWNLKTPAKEKPKAQSWGSADKVERDTPECEHGSMNYREGMTKPKDGKPSKPYAQWVCPLTNWQDRCPTVWIND